GGMYAYDLSYVSSGGVGSSGYFLLTPEANSQIKGAIQITPEALANSIYATIGDMNILTSSGGSTYLANLNTGANTEWGAAIGKPLVGFMGGYFVGSGGSLNPLLPGTVDLNKNWNFAPTYAFGGVPGGPAVSHPTSVTSGIYYDGYAKIFFDNTN